MYNVDIMHVLFFSKPEILDNAKKNTCHILPTPANSGL